MEANEVFKKFMDATIGLTSTAAEKIMEFTDQMQKKGQTFKEDKKEDFEKFFGTIKAKFEESTQSVMKALHLKDERVDQLEAEVKKLRKEVDELKGKK